MDWALVRDQNARVTLRPGTFTCVDPPGVIYPSDEDENPVITFRRDPNGKVITGHGSVGDYDRNNFTIDFSIVDGVNLTGTLSRRVYSSQLYSNWTWQGTFSCTISH